MKAIHILVLVISIVHSMMWAGGADLSSPANANNPNLAKPPAPAFDEPKPKLRHFFKRLRYSGALVDLSKSNRPLQLLNPFAPAKFGSGLNNLVIDSTTAKTKGIALFSVRY